MAEPIDIKSLDDPRIDVYRDVRDADLRGREHLFMAESELVVRRLLRTPERLHSLFLSPHKYERLRGAIEEAQWPQAAHAPSRPASARHSFPIYLADVQLMSEVAGFLIHRGALAAGFRLPGSELTLDRALGHLRSRPRCTLVLAEGITNVDNMGGLFRTAAAFGVDGILLDPTCCDPLYRKAIRVSVGLALAVPYAVSADWTTDVRRLKEQWGLTVIGAESGDGVGAMPLWKLPGADRIAFVFGSEAQGLDRRTREACDAIVEIPMSAGVSSLNVASAAAVVLYEVRRGG